MAATSAHSDPDGMALEAVIAQQREAHSIKPSDGAQSLQTLCEQMLANIEAMSKPTAEEIERREQHAARSKDQACQQERQAAWSKLVRKMGRRFGFCTIKSFQVDCDNQREAVKQITGYIKKMPERVSQGNGLVLFGPSGTGKDHLLVAAAREGIRQHGFTIEWINGVDFYAQCRAAIATDGEGESDLVKQLIKPQILIISDPTPPFGTLTDFQAQILYRVIDGRYSNFKATWVSLNVASGNEAGEKLGHATIDRLRHKAVSVFCDWPSFRAREE